MSPDVLASTLLRYSIPTPALRYPIPSDHPLMLHPSEKAFLFNPTEFKVEHEKPKGGSRLLNVPELH